jgi:hypothetical protein
MPYYTKYDGCYDHNHKKLLERIKIPFVPKEELEKKIERTLIYNEPDKEKFKSSLDDKIEFIKKKEIENVELKRQLDEQLEIKIKPIKDEFKQLGKYLDELDLRYLCIKHRFKEYQLFVSGCLRRRVKRYFEEYTNEELLKNAEFLYGLFEKKITKMINSKYAKLHPESVPEPVGSDEVFCPHCGKNRTGDKSIFGQPQKDAIGGIFPYYDKLAEERDNWKEYGNTMYENFIDEMARKTEYMSKYEDLKRQLGIELRQVKSQRQHLSTCLKEQKELTQEQDKTIEQLRREVADLVGNDKANFEIHNDHIRKLNDENANLWSANNKFKDEVNELKRMNEYLNKKNDDCCERNNLLCFQVDCLDLKISDKNCEITKLKATIKSHSEKIKYFVEKYESEPAGIKTVKSEESKYCANCKYSRQNPANNGKSICSETDRECNRFYSGWGAIEPKPVCPYCNSINIKTKLEIPQYGDYYCLDCYNYFVKSNSLGPAEVKLVEPEVKRDCINCKHSYQNKPDGQGCTQGICNSGNGNIKWELFDPNEPKVKDCGNCKHLHKSHKEHPCNECEIYDDDRSKSKWEKR